MKTICLTSLIVLLGLSGYTQTAGVTNGATIVIFDRLLTGQGLPSNRRVLIQPAEGYELLASGTNTVGIAQMVAYPTNGLLRVGLMPAEYTIQIEGISQTLHAQVFATNRPVHLQEVCSDLKTYLFTNLTSAAVQQVMAGTNITITPEVGKGTVTISAQGVDTNIVTSIIDKSLLGQQGIWAVLDETNTSAWEGVITESGDYVRTYEPRVFLESSVTTTNLVNITTTNVTIVSNLVTSLSGSNIVVGGIQASTVTIGSNTIDSVTALNIGPVTNSLTPTNWSDHQTANDRRIELRGAGGSWNNQFGLFMRNSSCDVGMDLWGSGYSGATYYDSRYNDSVARTYFRMRTAGTATNVLVLRGDGLVEIPALLIGGRVVTDWSQLTNGFVRSDVTNGLVSSATAQAWISASTNGFVGHDVTNGLISSASAQALTNGLVGSGVTNGLIGSGSVSALISAATNGFVDRGVTNGLAGAGVTNGLVGAGTVAAWIASATNGFVGPGVTNGTLLVGGTGAVSAAWMRLGSSPGTAAVLSVCTNAGNKIAAQLQGRTDLINANVGDNGDATLAMTTYAYPGTNSGNFFGLASDVYVMPGGSSSSSVMKGIVSRMLHWSGGPVIDSLIGFRSELTKHSISNLVGLVDYENGGYITAGSLTRYAGMHLKNCATNGGTVGTQYGLWIDELRSGSANWAVRTEGTTPSYFGGGVTVGNLLLAPGGIITNTLSGYGVGPTGTNYMPGLVVRGPITNDTLPASLSIDSRGWMVGSNTASQFYITPNGVVSNATEVQSARFDGNYYGSWNGNPIASYYILSSRVRGSSFTGTLGGVTHMVLQVDGSGVFVFGPNNGGSSSQTFGRVTVVGANVTTLFAWPTNFYLVQPFGTSTNWVLGPTNFIAGQPFTNWYLTLPPYRRLMIDWQTDGSSASVNSNFTMCIQQSFWPN